MGRIAGLAVLVLAACAPPPGDAFRVLDVSAHPDAAGHVRVDAAVHYRFSEPVRTALRNGVPITLEFQVQLRRPRAGLWPKTVAEVTHRYRIDYHNLSQRYLVDDLQTGQRSAFPRRTSALNRLGEVAALDLGPLPETGGPYSVRVRGRLDIEALPPPLRLQAHLSRDWRLSTGWRSVQLRP